MQEHRTFEEYINKWHEEFRDLGKKVHCLKGCSGCCTMAVHATYPEASAAARDLSAKQHEQLGLYIQRLQKALPNLANLKSYLKSHRQEIGPCPFLDDQGACTIYRERPLSCRSLLSTRPAAWCTADFSALDEWDKQAYENGLDKSIVAWPTHYIAATQEYGQKLEASILDRMQKLHSWSLSGNFALMVWLAYHCQQQAQLVTVSQLRNKLTANRLNSDLLLTFVTDGHRGRHNDRAV